MASSILSKAAWTVAGLAALGSAGYAARDPLSALIPQPQEVSVTQGRPAQPVRVTQVVFAATRDTHSYTGTIRPQHEAPLGFRLPGKLLSRSVDVGDLVTAGQIVARLDDTDARLELDAAEAELAAARTDLTRANDDLARNRDLFDAGHVAQAALDRATTAAAEAHSRADRAEQMRHLTANRLTYMDLVAEADGTVTATLAETGQVVVAGQPELSVARTDALDVVFALPEQQRDLAETAVASAELWGAGGNTYALTLRDIAPDTSGAGRTYRVRMTLTAPDADAALGRTVTVHLATQASQPLASLPLASVLNDGAGAAVWRLVPGTDRVERVPVTLIESDGHVAKVAGSNAPNALAAGDTVISLGAFKIDPARPVRVVETAATPES
jgi:RND family efflux transporter MFP subunit